MQEWVKKILSPFKKDSQEEQSESGSFSSWESMNPDEAAPRPQTRSSRQKNLITGGILLAVFAAIMLIQFTVQKFLHVGNKAPELASLPAPESAPVLPPAPIEVAPVEVAPAPVAEAPVVAAPTPAIEAPAAEVIAQAYAPQYNDQGEEVLPILEEKISAATTIVDPALAQIKPLYQENPNEEVLPILQETPVAGGTEIAANTATPSAEAYAPQYNAQGEEELPILEEKAVAENVPAPAVETPTVVVLGDSNAPSAEALAAAPSVEPAPAPSTETSSTAVASAAPAPVVPAPAPVVETPAPAPAPVVAAAPAPAPKKVKRVAPATVASATHTPEWLAKQNSATQKLLAEKAQNAKSAKKTIVVTPEGTSVPPTATKQEKQLVSNVPGFVPEENQSIASIGRE